MKIIQHSKKILLLLLVFLFGSCSDFLEKPLQGQLTQANFPVSGEDALLATNAVYHTLRINLFHQGLFPILDIMSDDGSKGSNPDDAAATVGPYDKFQHIPTEGNITRWWSTLYEGVKRANVVIVEVPKIAMDESLKARYIGEAKFLRALFYFDLVRAWGGVPIITELNPPSGSTRASRDEVYQLIIQDLLDASTALPEKSGYAPKDLGRATKGAAKGLLAKVYLFNGDFVNAEKSALEVINSNQYDLEADFSSANSVSGEFGVESVFEIGGTPYENITQGGSQYANVQGVRGSPNRGWGFNRPTLDLQDSFEPGDPRLDATVIYLGEVLDGITIVGDGPTPNETIVNNQIVEIECYNQKVWTPGDNVPTQFAHNRRILRYADVLLMAAEALNENNKSTEAKIYLNQVRERARMGNPDILPDVTESGKDALRTLIQRERRHELAMEGHRFWDLVRWGLADEVLGPLGFQAGKHELLPLPQSEIDLTQEVLEQNPNWN
jgi:starch-binding outer membrane protein, SusD/RagB family